MKPGTSKLLNTYFFILNQILKICPNPKNTDKKKLNDIFKHFYNQVYSSNYKSLTEFEKPDLRNLISIILIEFSVEYGIYLQQPHDPKNAANLSLSEYLEHIKWIMDNNAFKAIEGTPTLPEGFELIFDIKNLKQLKKGKRKWTQNNVELIFGKIVYVYSFKENLYYKKILSTYTPIDILTNYINKQILYG